MKDDQKGCMRGRNTTVFACKDSHPLTEQTLQSQKSQEQPASKSTRPQVELRSADSQP